MVAKKKVMVEPSKVALNLKEFAEVLMAQIGPAPSNWEQIVGEAINQYMKKQKGG